MKVKFYLNEAQKNSVWVLFFEHKNLFLQKNKKNIAISIAVKYFLLLCFV